MGIESMYSTPILQELLDGIIYVILDLCHKKPRRVQQVR